MIAAMKAATAFAALIAALAIVVSTGTTADRIGANADPSEPFRVFRDALSPLMEFFSRASFAI
jgi:hypothetical protein